jgi:hypothetical protein
MDSSKDVVAQLRKFLEDSTVNLSRKTSKNRAEFINTVIGYVNRLAPNSSTDSKTDDKIVRFVGKVPSAATAVKGVVVMTRQMSQHGE